MAPTVIVLGGGVAGLSAAHELVERGFRVDVYERTPWLGGKARSVTHNGLPGEHGFRIFPRFYRHLMDTMKRIPYQNQGLGVYRNLVDATEHLLATKQTKLKFLVRFPRSGEELDQMLRQREEFKHLGLTEEDLKFFGSRLWQLMTMCEERLADEYERIGWWEFLDAKHHTKRFQKLLAAGVTRTLVAADPHTASAQVGGRVLTAMLLAAATPGISSDRLLRGPTNEMWIDPWEAHLRKRGVQFHLGTGVTAFRYHNGAITGVTVGNGRPHQTLVADYYIAALPVERMAPLVTQRMIAADSSLDGISVLAKHHVGSMSGVQLYVTEPVPAAHGHVTYIDSPWALTSVSQKQFWPDVDLTQYGDGRVRDIISVDVSDWDQDGEHVDKRVRDCTRRDEIVKEIWKELQQRLGPEVLNGASLHSYNIDPEMVVGRHGTRNRTPLLINKKNSWHLRPEAHTRIRGLFLASDYVRTNTSLATMEAANEAARRAVNSIIDDYKRTHRATASEIDETPCEIWPFHCPLLLRPLRRRDRKRYRRGLPWLGQQPWWLRFLLWIASALQRHADSTARWAKRYRLTQKSLAFADMGLSRAHRVRRWVVSRRGRWMLKQLHAPVARWRGRGTS
jgi:uncharacterized protein with NAD-binding domain and iron-sulfur cluster